jgi:hypothetical protein
MNSSKSSLFLMEILLTILFFSIAGAVCLQLYVKAHLVDENTTEINHADEWAQNLAETYYGCRADTENIEAVYHDSCIGGSNDIVIALMQTGNRSPLQIPLLRLYMQYVSTHLNRLPVLFRLRWITQRSESASSGPR